MTRAVQKRTLATRAKLIAAAEAVIAESGYEALRVEEVVLRAGVAKGTFFAHFRDKDALMDILLGGRIDGFLDDLETAAVPQTVAELVDVMHPLHDFMSSERYVFDVIIRYSGAAAISEIGPIATTFGRYLNVVSQWMSQPAFRQDISTELMAEGIQAFAIQSMATRFCALHAAVRYQDRLVEYLSAWLAPQSRPLQ